MLLIMFQSTKWDVSLSASVGHHYVFVKKLLHCFFHHISVFMLELEI
jgi:hypothetical protein